MANLPETGFLREKQLIGQRAVSPAEAEENRAALRKAQDTGDAKAIKRAKGKPLRPRPGIVGIFPYGRATLWNKVRGGAFPSPVKLGPNISAWRVEDIQALIDGIA